ncbi:FecR family protein [Tunicatimonas pelagia]|uniref:FecR family protein n=1 Tax=Tunicatimonas pelagia TaxID=931531 RepID=UPI0026660517|nr:FecR domain-containing protein [Tunicatimonas pelagia]WKN44035.1 FecR domain-containing protein [Tunicatimonas pelagia]
MNHFNSVEDFAANLSFRKWVIDNDAQAEEAWRDYLSRYPEKAPLIEEAKRVVRELSRTTYRMSDQQFTATWRSIEADLSRPTVIPSSHRQRSVPLYWYYAAASLSALAIAAAVWLYLVQTTIQTYQTAYGETRELLLPDSSVVTLNANSTLAYNPADFQEHRVVQVAGEAYFAIKKQHDPQGALTSFIVNTEALAVEVLGTEFNVNTRRARTQVVLTEGSVKLQLPAEAVETPIYMNPGDMVTYQPEIQKIQQTLVNPALHTAWKRSELVFEDTPVREIIYVLEDTYGLTITLEDESVAHRKYTGTFHEPDPEIILLALKTLFNLEINRNGNVIILQ